MYGYTLSSTLSPACGPSGPRFQELQQVIEVPFGHLPAGHSEIHRLTVRLDSLGDGPLDGFVGLGRMGFSRLVFLLDQVMIADVGRYLGAHHHWGTAPAIGAVATGAESRAWEPGLLSANRRIHHPRDFPKKLP